MRTAVVHSRGQRLCLVSSLGEEDCSSSGAGADSTGHRDRAVEEGHLSHAPGLLLLTLCFIV